jgi:hypothetical protein
LPIYVYAQVHQIIHRFVHKIVHGFVRKIVHGFVRKIALFSYRTENRLVIEFAANRTGNRTESYADLNGKSYMCRHGLLGWANTEEKTVWTEQLFSYTDFPF